MSTTSIQISATLDGPCQRVIDIAIPSEIVNETLVQIEKKIQAQAKIPGFRPGKAPAHLVRNRFARPIREEAASTLKQEGIRQAMAQMTDRPMSLLEYKDKVAPEVTRDQEFRFKIGYDVAPPITLPEYKGMKLTVPKNSISDADVDHFIEHLRSERSSYTPADRPAARGDMLRVRYNCGLSGGVDVPDASKGLLKQDETWLMLSGDEIIPGSLERLIGVAPGNDVSLHVTFPADYKDSFLAGKSTDYQFSVLEVHARELPEINDEFAKEFGVDDVVALKKVVYDRMNHDLTMRMAAHLRSQVIRFLITKSDAPLPPQMFAVERYNTFLTIAEHLGPDHIAMANTDSAREQLLKTVDEVAEERLKLHFIVNEIAGKEGISVSEQEVDEVFQKELEQMRSRGGRGGKDFESRQEELKSAVEAHLLKSKVISFIMEHAEISQSDGPVQALDCQH